VDPLVADVVVVGSINSDLSVTVPRLPDPGTTVLGARLAEGDGGKGANQAVAVARLGGRVRLIGRVGDDERGQRLLAGLRSEGVETDFVLVDESEPTGAALILVDTRGENIIAVAPGANARVSADQVVVGLDTANASVLLAQLEVPLDIVVVAAGAARDRGMKVVLNAAPATVLPSNLNEFVDVLVVNRAEAVAALSMQLPDKESVLAGASRAHERGFDVVITLGPEGVVAASAGHVWYRTADVVNAVDTVGAGDTFAGAVALLLAEGRDLFDAVDLAASAGALAVCRRGARAGMPDRAALDRFRQTQPGSSDVAVGNAR
jgi:ribokinase